VERTDKQSVNSTPRLPLHGVGNAMRLSKEERFEVNGFEITLQTVRDEELLADCGMQLQTLGEVTKNLVVY